LFENSKYDRWIAIAEIESPVQRAKACKAMVLELDHYNRALITVLFYMLHDMIRYCKYTQMDSKNLSRVIAPNVFMQDTSSALTIAEFTSMAKVIEIVETLISQFDVVFRELKVQHPLVQTINQKKAASLRSNMRKGERREVPSVPPSKENTAAVEAESKPALLKRKSESTNTIMTKKKQKSADFQQDSVVSKTFKRSAPPAELARSKTYAGFGEENNAQPNSPPPASAGKIAASRTPVNMLQPLTNL
jgi:hypothetical protein